MKRRSLLKSLAGGFAASRLHAGVTHTRLPRMGKGGALKKLVVLFQRGGNDALNTLVPVDSIEYNLYRQLRPTLALPQSGLFDFGINDFLVHPSFNRLRHAYNAGNLAFIHAVGYPQPDRSHFEAQSFLETAIPGNSVASGWLNRFLENTSGPGQIRGLTIDSGIDQSLTGSIPAPASRNFGTLDIDSPSNSDPYRELIRDAYSESATAGNSFLYSAGLDTFRMVDQLGQRNLNDYVPENNADYPDDGLGNRVRHAAQLLKDDSGFLGVEVVTIDQGGYDTHARQVPSSTNLLGTDGTHSRLLKSLGDSMAAFYADMGPARMQNILFLVVSEFSRRAKQNDSLGTDHGTGSLAIVMGGGVNGGMYNGEGDWPGLANLYRGRDLDWRTDYRDIYWDVLSAHMGLSNATIGNIIPAHTHASTGLF